MLAVLRFVARSTRRGVLLAGTLAACTESVGPPLEPQSLAVRGTLLDTAANPVDGALSMLRVYTADSVAFSLYPPPYAITDSLGQFALSWDSVGTAPIDSVVVESMAPGCQDTGQVTVIPGPDVPPGQAPALELTITQLNVRPPARTLPGKYCAFGVHPFWGPGAYIFGLQIDSLNANNIWGHWRVSYRFTNADDAGSFVGSATATFVVLHLTTDNPWNACVGVRLYVPVLGNGAWGPATIYGEQECLPAPLPFMFVADTLPYPFP